MKKKAAPQTPVRRALRLDSALLSLVCDGLSAVKKAHRDYFDAGIRTAFADSLELDEAVRQDHDRENRWDYLLGHAGSGAVVAVEPHTARDGEISTLIKKRAAAREQLRGHLREGARGEVALGRLRPGAVRGHGEGSTPAGSERHRVRGHEGGGQAFAR